MFKHTPKCPASPWSPGSPRRGAAVAARRPPSRRLPDHLTARGHPALVLQGIDLIDALALDLERRGKEVVVDRPRRGHDDQAGQLLVRIECRVDAAQVLRQRALQLGPRRRVRISRDRDR